MPSDVVRRWSLCLCVFAIASACTRSVPERLEPGLIAHRVEPTEILPASRDLMDLGRTTYEKECLACHGGAGEGFGDAAYLLYPRPRDFTVGQFRLISTWDGVLTDVDLFRTISRGMPGSAMPSWAHLNEETRWGLVHYVKTFSKRPIVVKASHEPDKWGNGGQRSRLGARRTGV